MKITRNIVALFVAVAVAGCGSSTYEEPIKVNSQFNPAGHPGEYKTWNFVDYGDIQADLGVLEDAAFRLQLATLIENAMAERGFQHVFESPDLEIGFHAGKETLTEAQLEEWYADYEWYAPSARGAKRNDWQKGSLILFVFDAKSGQMIWRSAADAVIDQNLSEKERRTIAEKAVELMLDEMPGGDKE